MTMNDEGHLLYFPAHELKPYGQPVSARDLQEGKVYFAVTFVDDRMCIPLIETLVFVGKDLEPEDQMAFYFQDVESFLEGVRWGTSDELAQFQKHPENAVGHIFSYDEALVHNTWLSRTGRARMPAVPVRWSL